MQSFKLRISSRRKGRPLKVISVSRWTLNPVEFLVRQLRQTQNLACSAHTVVQRHVKIFPSHTRKACVKRAACMAQQVCDVCKRKFPVVDVVGDSAQEAVAAAAQVPASPSAPHWRQSLTSTSISVLGGLVATSCAVAATPAVLSAIGFTATGIAAGSWAASWMGAGVKAGSLFATLQSFAATGCFTLTSGLGTVAAGTGVGGVFGLVADVRRGAGTSAVRQAGVGESEVLQICTGCNRPL